MANVHCRTDYSMHYCTSVALAFEERMRKAIKENPDLLCNRDKLVEFARRNEGKKLIVVAKEITNDVFFRFPKLRNNVSELIACGERIFSQRASVLCRRCFLSKCLCVRMCLLVCVCVLDWERVGNDEFLTSRKLNLALFTP